MYFITGQYFNGELCCNECGSTFVEESDQGIEEFTTIEQHSNDVDDIDGYITLLIHCEKITSSQQQM
jgi:hypothetical protein